MQIRTSLIIKTESRVEKNTSQKGQNLTSGELLNLSEKYNTSTEIFRNDFLHIALKMKYNMKKHHSAGLVPPSDEAAPSWRFTSSPYFALLFRRSSCVPHLKVSFKIWMFILLSLFFYINFPFYPPIFLSSASIKKMRSESTTVDSLCATINVVRFCIRFLIAFCTTNSDSASRAEVAWGKWNTITPHVFFGGN